MSSAPERPTIPFQTETMNYYFDYPYMINDQLRKYPEEYINELLGIPKKNKKNKAGELNRTRRNNPVYRYHYNVANKGTSFSPDDREVSFSYLQHLSRHLYSDNPDLSRRARDNLRSVGIAVKEIAEHPLTPSHRAKAITILLAIVEVLHQLKQEPVLEQTFKMTARNTGKINTKIPVPVERYKFPPTPINSRKTRKQRNK